MEAALRPFGWTCGPDFWRRYHSDPWVFHLANAVEQLSSLLPQQPGTYRLTRHPNGQMDAPVKLRGYDIAGDAWIDAPAEPEPTTRHHWDCGVPSRQECSSRCVCICHDTTIDTRSLTNQDDHRD